MEEASKLKKREGSAGVAPMKEMLEEFDREVQNDRRPCKRHEKVQKALGKYLVTNGGPIRREVKVTYPELLGVRANP